MHGSDADDALVILLVEDSPGDARYIRELLPDVDELSELATTRPVVSAGRPVGAARGEPTVLHETRLADGLERLEERRIDVVLLDLNLPDSEGIETVDAVRRRTETVPIVVLTGVRDRGTGMEALRRGAEEYLVKDEINADLLIRSIWHAIERTAHERELEQYRTLIETVNDGVYAVDDDSNVVIVNDALVSMTGYERAELLGAPSSLIVDGGGPVSGDRDRPPGSGAGLEPPLDAGDGVEPSADAGAGDRVMVEAELRTADGRTVPIETNFAPFPLRDDRTGRVGVVRDITARKERERQLKRQRNQLASLRDLDELVHDITHLAIEQSTREEIERVVCESLADSESYAFAWVGEVDRDHETVRTRSEVGVEGYLDGITIRIDDAETGRGPTGRAVRTGEVQVAQNLPENPDYEPWWDHARKHGVRSSAAIPITHDDTTYGVLNVYSERPDAFEDDERVVVGRLGKTIGHAINAVERKRALMSEDVVELRFRIANVCDALDLPPTDGRITFDRAVPVSDDAFLQYGTVTEDAVETLRALVEARPHFESVTIRDDDRETRRFEAQLTEPPTVSTVASYGGQVVSAVIDGGEYSMVVHVPPSADVGDVVDAVRAEYPEAEVLAKRDTTRTGGSAARPGAALREDLTGKQVAALEAAYFSGFFEWPRDATGEEVAESMGINPSTFHQHVRIGERKLLRALFDSDRTGA